MTGLSQEYVDLISQFDLHDFSRSLLRVVWILGAEKGLACPTVHVLFNVPSDVCVSWNASGNAWQTELHTWHFSLPTSLHHPLPCLMRRDCERGYFTSLALPHSLASTLPTLVTQTWLSRRKETRHSPRRPTRQPQVHPCRPVRTCQSSPMPPQFLPKAEAQTETQTKPPTRATMRRPTF